MSLIEQAAKRLDELRRAGIEVPEIPQGASNASEAPANVIESAAARLHSARVTPVGTPRPGAASHKTRSQDSEPSSTANRIDLDFAAIAAIGIITPDAPRSQVADEFRIIKRPLIQNATGRGAALVKNGNLILVTSAVPGEGKSFTAVNLAMSIAMELDHTVLLVDADVARPSLPGMLGLPPARGLLDVLIESAELGDVLLKTNVEKLSLLTSGTQHPRATELLASDAMNRLLEELAGRYRDRIVVFDSPPLLATTEAPVLAAHMGQVVVVVQAGQTPPSAVIEALTMIETCPVKLMMLNKGRWASEGRNYGAGYGYGYGYGSGQ